MATSKKKTTRAKRKTSFSLIGAISKIFRDDECNIGSRFDRASPRRDIYTGAYTDEPAPIPGKGRPNGGTGFDLLAAFTALFASEADDPNEGGPPAS